MSSRGRPWVTGIAAVALAVSMSSCGGPSGTVSSQGSNASVIAAPAQQESLGDFAAPAQIEPKGPDTTTAEVADPAPPVPGLGETMSAQIPAETTQVLVASGEDESSESGTLTVYDFTGGAWHRLRTFPIHNGSNGWRADRREGDGTTPVGVFTLTDAGGAKANPGTKLAYTRDQGLPASAEVAYGPGYRAVFDYIVAIDYNRTLGTPPTDRRRPLGAEKGGGIWLHLDHDSGTHGCVTLKEADLVWIMRTLDPAAHPRIAMGPVADVEG